MIAGQIPEPATRPAALEIRALAWPRAITDITDIGITDITDIAVGRHVRDRRQILLAGLLDSYRILQNLQVTVELGGVPMLRLAQERWIIWKA